MTRYVKTLKEKRKINDNYLKKGVYTMQLYEKYLRNMNSSRLYENIKTDDVKKATNDVSKVKNLFLKKYEMKKSEIDGYLLFLQEVSRSGVKVEYFVAGMNKGEDMSSYDCKLSIFMDNPQEKREKFGFYRYVKSLDMGVEDFEENGIKGYEITYSFEF